MITPLPPGDEADAFMTSADGASLNGIKSGASNGVTHDRTKRDGFRLVGPGVDRRTPPVFVGRQCGGSASAPELSTATARFQEKGPGDGAFLLMLFN